MAIGLSKTNFRCYAVEAEFPCPKDGQSEEAITYSQRGGMSKTTKLLIASGALFLLALATAALGSIANGFIQLPLLVTTISSSLASIIFMGIAVCHLVGIDD